ncbi:hypothetical protein B566_EDAN012624 [Ephemera danica]|nr:hypothetical protein B566_EDAN012624 [Ephemera danica]
MMGAAEKMLYALVLVALPAIFAATVPDNRVTCLPQERASCADGIDTSLSLMGAAEKMLYALVLVALPAIFAATVPDNRVTCLPQEAADLTCSLAAGSAVISELPAPVRPDELKHPQRLVAALDSQLAASGFLGDHDVNGVSASVSRPRPDVVLDRVHIFGFPATSPPRVLRLNGQLLRRGDLHYHRDTQSLELFDLALSLDVAWHLELLSADAAADQVECPAECFSPCVWDGATGCWLPGPLDYGYTVNGPVENTTFGWRVPLRKFGASLYNAAVQYIDLEIFVYSESFVRFKIYDPDQQRFEVPIALNLPSQPFTGQTNFDVVFPTIQGSIFFLQVVRRDTGTVIFDTSMAGITFEDQLLSIALRLPSRNLYGIGESYHATFRRELDDSTWPLWSRDEPPNPFVKNNLYGVHPSSGKMTFPEYQLQSAAPAVVWRTIGGILDFYVVTGPTPEDVIKQYTNIVGRSFLPPYWSLGFQLSRYGYNSLENLTAAVERTISCDIPLVTDFTVDPINFPGLPAYVDEKRSQGMRYVPILDPTIASGRPGYATYDRGLVANCYILQEDGQVLLGNVWPPEPVSFPDFFRSNTSAWWTEEIRLFYQTIKFDGLWIDMNEPANFDTNVPDPEGGYRLICPTSPLDDPPYTPKAGAIGSVKRINDKTICMNTRQGDNNIYSHYDVHSLYGYSETIPTSATAGLQSVWAAVRPADQDPCIWPDTVGASTRTAMNIRYRLLPYFYTMFYRANQGLEGTGKPLASIGHRENAFGLVIALDEAGAASGDLFWDDGESIDTVAAGQYHYSTLAFADVKLAAPERRAPVAQGKFVEDVEVFGMATQPTGVTGDVGTNVFIAFDANNQKVSLLNAHIPADIDYVVTFTFN